MTDVPETLRAIEKIIREKLSPDTDNPSEDWPRFLALLRIKQIADETSKVYPHAADELGD